MQWHNNGGPKNDRVWYENEASFVMLNLFDNFPPAVHIVVHIVSMYYIVATVNWLKANFMLCKKFSWAAGGYGKID